MMTMTALPLLLPPLPPLLLLRCCVTTEGMTTTTMTTTWRWQPQGRRRCWRERAAPTAMGHWRSRRGRGDRAKCAQGSASRQAAAQWQEHTVLGEGGDKERGEGEEQEDKRVAEKNNKFNKQAISKATKAGFRCSLEQTGTLTVSCASAVLCEEKRSSKLVCPSRTCAKMVLVKCGSFTMSSKSCSDMAATMRRPEITRTHARTHAHGWTTMQCGATAKQVSLKKKASARPLSYTHIHARTHACTHTYTHTQDKRKQTQRDAKVQKHHRTRV